MHLTGLTEIVCAMCAVNVRETQQESILFHHYIYIKGTMTHRFTTTPETAHMLTKTSKKEKFYFRTLTCTDRTDTVTCETTEPGLEYIKENNINVLWTK